MYRKKIGILLIILGLVLFVVSLFYILPIPDLYIFSLFMMFIGVVLIGIGAAFAKRADKSLDIPKDECYYCKGIGKIKSGDEFETCPRCGGTGLARPDDT